VVDAAPRSTTSLRRTKLVCTLGPASATRIGELVAAGMDVARLNFSHGSAESHARTADAVRQAAAGRPADRPIAILADLSGPKIRLGAIDGDEVTLEPGRPFRLHTGPESRIGDSAGATVTYPALGADLRPGDRILLADGAAELRVTSADPAGGVDTQVVRGGTVRSRAGVGVPTERLSTPALTEQDVADLPRVADIGADYVAQSFVRRAADIEELRRRLGPDGPPIVAKIETRPAVDDFDAILEAADAVMIARGDLGVELPYEEVPVVQKQLLRRCLDRGVPSIVATQMLESMVRSPRPTRAEASDVANAVFDGADAIMLSAETAIGEWPILAAEAAVRIARFCEDRGQALLPEGSEPTEGDAGGVAYAASTLAATDPAVAGIACSTRTGRTARQLAALRPAVPIFAFTDDEAVARRLALIHGVVARVSAPSSGDDGLFGAIVRQLREFALVPPGRSVVLVASTAQPGTGPNLLEVHRVPEA
jgi:pyruvate kinase